MRAKVFYFAILKSEASNFVILINSLLAQCVWTQADILFNIHFVNKTVLRKDFQHNEDNDFLINFSISYTRSFLP